MAKSAGGGPDDPEGLPQSPYVERLKPHPSQPARRVIDLTGLAGNSDRPGYQRLYLTTRLDYYAEFLTSDMVHTEAIPADQSPFPGHEATRVSVSRDATIHYIWARSPQPVDEFDLDIRLGAPRAAPFAPGLLPATRPPAHTCILDGTCLTCDGTCGTCPGQGATCAHTCDTCATQCFGTCAGQATCPNTQCATCGNQQTCQTCAGQATCAAGATCAGHGTCQATCATACQQMTCITCQGATCPQTCVG
jgi:hypothetical protein